MGVLAITQIWQVTVVILAVALAARIAGRHRAHLAHLLWMLVLVKALTPPLVSTPWSVFEWIRWPDLVSQHEPALGRFVTLANSPQLDSNLPANAGVAAGAAEPEGIVDDDAIINHRIESISSETGRVVPAATGMNSRLGVAAVAAVWLFGAVLTASLAVVKLAWFYRSVRRAAVRTDPRLQGAVDRLRQSLGIRRPVSLIVSGRAHVPTAFGFQHARIVVSRDLVQHASAEQLQMTLAHELIHIRRGDLYWGLLQVLTQIVWWFHPLVWWANQQATRTIEGCCDQEVLQGSSWRPASYARCLLELGRLHQQAKWAPVLPAMRPLEITRRRLEGIVRGPHKFHRRAPRRYWVLTFAVALFVLPGASPTRTIEKGDAGAASGPSRSTVDRDTADRDTADRTGTRSSLPSEVELERPADRLERLLPPAIFVLGDDRLMHWNSARPLGFAADETLVTSSIAGTLRYWDVNTGRQRQQVDLPPSIRDTSWRKLTAEKSSGLHSGAVLSADGQSLFLGRADGTIEILGAADQQRRRTLRVPGGWIKGLAISADGLRVAALRQLGAEDPRTAMVLDTATGQVVGAIGSRPFRENSIWSLAVLNKDGTLLATAYHEFVVLWEVASGRLLHTLEHRDEQAGFTVWTLSFSPDSQTLATGGAGGDVRFWDVESGEVRLSLRHHRASVRTVAFSPTGEFLATAAKQIKLFNASTGELVWATSAPHDDHGLAFNATGNLLAAGVTHRVIVLETATGRVVAPRDTAARSIACMAVSSTSHQLVVGMPDGQLATWNYVSGKRTANWQGHDSGAQLATGNNGPGLAKWQGFKSAVSQVAYSPDGRTVSSLSESGGKLALWDARTGTLRHALESQIRGRRQMAFSADGATLATRDATQVTTLWDVASGELQRTVQFEQRRSALRPIVFGPTDNILFGLTGRQVTQWDLKEQSVIKTFDLNTRWGGQVRFAVSPDAARVAAGVRGGVITVWDTATGEKIELVGGHSNHYLHALAFSRDGNSLASAAEDGKVQIWNPVSGELVKTIQIGPHRGIIGQLAFSFDQHYLITVNGNGTAYVVDVH